MKTIQSTFKTTLLLLVVGFAFVSCSSDDSAKNQAPNSFALNDVPDGKDLQPKLTWETATDPDGDDVSYQVYLDTQNPPQITIANNLGVSTFNVVDKLQFKTTYYWKVIAKDSEGNTTESNIASFTTKMKTAEAILGKWFYESIEQPGAPPLTECQKKTSYNFLKSGVVEEKLYAPNSSDVCELNRDIKSVYEVVSENKITIIGDKGKETRGIEIKNSVLSLSSEEGTIKFRR